ncbi:MAG: hypothetical protein R3D71_11175 [Rickettsiales bacterium]
MVFSGKHPIEVSIVGGTPEGMATAQAHQNQITGGVSANEINVQHVTNVRNDDRQMAVS